MTATDRRHFVVVFHFLKYLFLEINLFIIKSFEKNPKKIELY